MAENVSSAWPTAKQKTYILLITSTLHITNIVDIGFYIKLLASNTNAFMQSGKNIAYLCSLPLDNHLLNYQNITETDNQRAAELSHNT